MKYPKKLCDKCDRLININNYNFHYSICKGIKQKPKYKLNHEDLFCLYCHKECKNKISLAQHEIRCKLNPNRIDISNCFGNLEGKNKWNLGLTKETDERIQKQITTFNTNQKLGLHINHPKHISKEHIEKIKASKFGGYNGKHSVNYNGILLDSSYELQVAKSLDANNIKWNKPKRKLFKYYEENNINKPYHYYTPDFYLPDYDIYLDPKNDFLINNINPQLGFKDIDKIKWVELYNNVTIIVLTKNELDWKYIKSKIDTLNI